MLSNKEKAIEQVVKRLVDEVDKEFEKHGNPYNFEKLIYKQERKNVQT